MATWQNIAGTWKSGNWWVNVGGVWRQVNVWQNVLGTWKNLSTQFTPDGGNVFSEDIYNTSAQLTCNVPATWTYSTQPGSGGSVNLASGDTATSIIFYCSAGGGSIGNRPTRSRTWNVTGVANGVTRNFVVQLIADGDDPQS